MKQISLQDTVKVIGLLFLCLLAFTTFIKIYFVDNKDTRSNAGDDFGSWDLTDEDFNKN